MVLGRKKRSPGRFSYTDQIPGYDAGDNPLGDIAPRPRPPQDVPPEDVPIDPGLGGGDGSGSPAGDVPPAPPAEEVPIDPGLGGGDGSGSSSGTGPANDFKPHIMYDPETGIGYTANTYQDHLYYDSLGYVHDKPGGNGAESVNDYALIGVISLLFFGGLILGLRK